MSLRPERVAGEVRAVLGEVLARDEIKDPRVRGVGLITVTHVRVSGDLRHARALFTVHGLDDAALERVRAGLDHASGYFRHAISRRLRTKVSPAVTFEVDHVFDQAMRLESLLREIRPAAAKPDPKDDGGDDPTTTTTTPMTAPVLVDGVLVVDKPSGPTSFDVVRRIRHASKVRRVGHGGTLDPLASGVLPICLGEGTKLAQFLLDADKEYEVTLALGVETDTYDAAGTVTARDLEAAARIGEAAVRAALPAFTGPIRQTPPVYSALKRDGRPLYDYARAGEPVEVAPRDVTIHELALGPWAGPSAVALRVRCSKGTYIRSLAFDLGRTLGVGAHVTALRRTRSGPFALAEARPLEEVLRAFAGGAAPPLVPLEDALGHLPRCPVDATGARALEQGKRVPWAALVGAPEGGRVAVLRPDGGLLAVAEPRPDGTIQTLRVFGVSSVESARIH